MKKFIFCLVAFLLGASMSWAAPEPKFNQDLILVVGNPKTVSFKYDIGEIAIGDPGVCSVVADREKQRIILTPLKSGQTSLLIFDRSGHQRENIRITVTSEDIDELIREIQTLFSDIEGINIKRVGQKVVIDGEVYLPEELDRINSVVRGSKTVVSLVKLSAERLKILAKKIQRELDLPGVNVSVVKDRIILRGEVYNKGDIEKATAIANIFADRSAEVVNVLNFKQVEKPPSRQRMVQITAYFVELDKEFVRNFNFYFGPVPNVRAEYGIFRRTDGVLAQTMNLLATVTDLFPRLNTARALGVARVFENPTVSVKSGDPAVISGGSQISFPSQTANGGIVYSEPQQVGVSLNVTPTVVGNDVDLKVNVEVSEFGSQMAPGVISVEKSTVETSQYVRSGESAAIGGLIRSRLAEARDKPADTPVSSGFTSYNEQGVPTVIPGGPSTFGNLFTLFKSRDIQKRRSQFIVFITPRVLGDAREANQELREQFNLDTVQPVSAAIEEP